VQQAHAPAGLLPPKSNISQKPLLGARENTTQAQQFFHGFRRPPSGFPRVLFRATSGVEGRRHEGRDGWMRSTTWWLAPGPWPGVESGVLAVNQCGRWGWVPGKQPHMGWGKRRGRARSPPQLHCLVVGSTFDSDLIPVRGKGRQQAEDREDWLVLCPGPRRTRVAAIHAWSARRRERTVRN
jgi:hypothetical protein